jgi:Tfp pilus assembly major pilin PilA
MFCTKCGSQVVDGAQFCTQCGQGLGVRPASDSPVAAAEDEYLETAIGPRNLDYYLKRFEKFSAGGGSVSWNWPAFFVPLIWMLYRKMWVWALAYFFLLPIAMFAVFAVLFILLPPGAAAAVGWAVQLGILFVLIPMFANALYYRTVQARIADAKAYRGDRDKQLRMLASSGGTSAAALVVVVIMIVPTVGILAAIALPAYQDYAIRAQVSEGLNLAQDLKAAVEQSFLAAGSIPADRMDAGVSPDATDSAGQYVRSIAISDGRIDIVYSGAASSVIANKVLSLTPYGRLGQDDEWSVLWRCGHGAAPADATHELSPYEPGTMDDLRYLPSGCRP